MARILQAKARVGYAAAYRTSIFIYFFPSEKQHLSKMNGVRRRDHQTLIFLQAWAILIQVYPKQL